MSGERTVLVCDDEPHIVRALRLLLRDAGFRVEAAASAQEALDRAALHPPDAAIIDLILPDGDGVEVTRSLREWTQVPIIVLSAVGEEDAKVRALQAGADDYVTKPFGACELIARLEAALRRVGGTAERPAERSRPQATWTCSCSTRPARSRSATAGKPVHPDARRDRGRACRGGADGLAGRRDA